MKKYIVIPKPSKVDAAKAKEKGLNLVSGDTFSMIDWKDAEVCGAEYYAKKAEKLGAKIVGDIIKDKKSDK